VWQESCFALRAGPVTAGERARSRAQAALGGLFFSCRKRNKNSMRPRGSLRGTVRNFSVCHQKSSFALDRLRKATVAPLCRGHPAAHHRRRGVELVTRFNARPTLTREPGVTLHTCCKDLAASVPNLSNAILTRLPTAPAHFTGCCR